MKNNIIPTDPNPNNPLSFAPQVTVLVAEITNQLLQNNPDLKSINIATQPTVTKGITISYQNGVTSLNIGCTCSYLVSLEVSR